MIRLKNIHYSYQLDGLSVPILKNINLEIQKGDFVAIQGPSGSGKSTLLGLMGCFLKVQSGEILINGINVSSLNDRDLAVFRNRRLGFVFQQFHLLPRTTVLKNVLLPTIYPTELAPELPRAEGRAREIAAFLGLDERLEHMPNQLSGGQQQRVAIARALMNDPEIILADEPTGNLDSKSAAQIMQLFAELNKQGKTIIMITHDAQVAGQCHKIYHIKDGEIAADSTSRRDVSGEEALTQQKFEKPKKPFSTFAFFRSIFTILPMAFANLRLQKTRTALTMLGVIIGIASVISMVTLGQFTKEKILASYADLGVNTLLFSGHPNRRMKAVDRTPVIFTYFDWQRDLEPIPRIFPQIVRMSPILNSWGGTLTYGGKSIDEDVTVKGINEDAIPMMQRPITEGRNFNPIHIENRSAVCIIGSDVAQTLFAPASPVGQILFISKDESSYACRIIGVLAPTSSPKDYSKPNLSVFLPFTFLQSVSSDWGVRNIRQTLLEVRDGVDPVKTGKAVQTFFESKYGVSGNFRVSSDSVLLAQMNKFLTMFTFLLASIAFVSLMVGGIGITNMMLVSVSERFREIGLRKALGATDQSIRLQFLMESVIICSIAGVIGLGVGFAGYETVIFFVSKLVKKVPFEWVWNIWAFSLSFIAIFVVGVLSGYFPALKAQKLQVMEALRSE